MEQKRPTIDRHGRGLKRDILLQPLLKIGPHLFDRSPQGGDEAGRQIARPRRSSVHRRRFRSVPALQLIGRTERQAIGARRRHSHEAALQKVSARASKSVVISARYAAAPFAGSCIIPSSYPVYPARDMLA